MQRHCFRLKDGTIYEGYIDEIRKDRIVFFPAPGPMFYDDVEVEIPIDDITLIIYYNDDGEQKGKFWDFLRITSYTKEPTL